MGSLTSRPKIVSVPTVAASVVTTDASASTTPATATVIEADPVEIAKTRAENVLRRSRSALGTVMTSFRGVLSANGVNPQRKSLLGE